MASFNLRHLCFTVVLFSIAFSCCRGQGGGGGAGTQDAIQIVAQAALCFDNRTAINACVQALNATGASASANTLAAANGTRATICSPPCFGMMTTWMGCLNGILGNIQGYSPGIMQGVQSIFQMACGNATTGAANGTATAAAGGGNGGAMNVSSTRGAYVVASSADGPTVSLRGICSSVLISFAGIWLALF